VLVANHLARRLDIRFKRQRKKNRLCNLKNGITPEHVQSCLLAQKLSVSASAEWVYTGKYLMRKAQESGLCALMHVQRIYGSGLLHWRAA